MVCLYHKFSPHKEHNIQPKTKLATPNLKQLITQVLLPKQMAIKQFKPEEGKECTFSLVSGQKGVYSINACLSVTYTQHCEELMRDRKVIRYTIFASFFQ